MWIAGDLSNALAESVDLYGGTIANTQEFIRPRNSHHHKPGGNPHTHGSGSNNDGLGPNRALLV